jgi:hypothetical protein
MRGRSVSRLALAIGLLACVAGSGSTPILADEFQAPDIEVVSSGEGKAVLRLTAAATGTPYGFVLRWIKRSDFLANGSQWPIAGDARVRQALFNGTPTLNTTEEEGLYSSFLLGAGERITVEVGDLFDETGVVTNEDGTQELSPGVEYVFSAFAAGAGGVAPSSQSEAAQGSTVNSNCTYTQGYWKNHEEAWPVSSLTLGTVTYTKAQLLEVLGTPSRGNGLVSMAHQLIAAKLNIANGANPTTISGTIAQADAQIGNQISPSVGNGYLAPKTTSSKTQALDNYNNGVSGPGHCGATSARGATWGRLKEIYRR